MQKVPCGSLSRPYTGEMAIDGNIINEYIKCLYGADTAEILAVWVFALYGE